MYCPKCGSPIVPASNFCTRCGTPLPVVPPGSPSSDAALLARPAVITLLAILDLVFGGIWLLATLGLSFTLTSGKSDPEDLVLALIFGVLGLTAMVAGVGLLRMKEYGRIVQLVLSTIGLLGIPIGTIISALVLYYLTRPGVRVLFSGRPVEQLTPEEIGAVSQLRGSGGAGVAIAVAVGLLVLVAVMGILAAIAIPNLLTAMQRSKQKRTMADMRSVATAWEAYATDHNTYAPTDAIGSTHPATLTDERGVMLEAASRIDASELENVLVPTYLRMLPQKDGWEREIELFVGSDGQEYAMRSSGKNGVAESEAYQAGPIKNFDCDIVYALGEFIAYPEGAAVQVDQPR
ncbi:MAG: zinc-ribbon domain-containing protein [Thermoanaerobaculia bacterium]|nr:zinc-ribbon domain-containing protein [Thermoanaerobaculia bacterium]